MRTNVSRFIRHSITYQVLSSGGGSVAIERVVNDDVDGGDSLELGSNFEGSLLTIKLSGELTSDIDGLVLI